MKSSSLFLISGQSATFIETKNKHQVFNEDANELIKKIKGEFKKIKTER